MAEMPQLDNNKFSVHTETETRFSSIPNSSDLREGSTTLEPKVSPESAKSFPVFVAAVSQLQSGRNRKRERLNTQLLDAAKINDLDECSRLIENGADVNATCRDSGATVLMICSSWGYDGLITFLLDKGASPLIRDKEGRTPIHVSAALGHEDALRVLLNREDIDELINIQVEDINEYGEDYYPHLDSWVHQHESLLPEMPELCKGSTPLHAASQMSNACSVKLLLDKGADTEMPDCLGRTPLDVAGVIVHRTNYIHQQKNEFTEDLRSSDFPISFTRKLSFQRFMPVDDYNEDLANISDTTPTKMHKSSTGRVIQEIMDTRKRRSISTSDQFRNSNEDFNLIQDDDRNQIFEPAGGRFPETNVQTFRMLLPMRQFEEKQIKSCLHTAVERKDEDLIDYLINDKYDYIFHLDEKGRTPAHLAVEMKDPTILELLLKRSDIVDTQDSEGRSLLYRAAQLDWIEGVDCLLNDNADITKLANDGSSVLHVAARKNNSQILEELLTFDAAQKIVNYCDDEQRTPLHCAVEESSVSCVKYLLGNNTTCERIIQPGKLTLLHIAAQKGSKDIVELLLTSCGNRLIDSRGPDSDGGLTPLHIACKEGHVECVELLINFGANIHKKTSSRSEPYYGGTSLHIAARYGRLSIAKALIESESNIQSSNNISLLDQRNGQSWQPLHVAARFGKKDCIRLFLNLGCNLASEVILDDGYRKTALDIILYFVPQPIEFLEEVLDSFIIKSEYPLSHEDCVVTFKYDLFSPTREDNHNQICVLDAVINSPKTILQENLLHHPLAETFLFLKWKKLRIFFFMMFAIYCFLTFSITAMNLTICTDILYEVPEIVNIYRVATIISLAVLATLEIFQASRLQRYYWTEAESWVKWLTFALAGWLALPSCSPLPDCPASISATGSVHTNILNCTQVSRDTSETPGCFTNISSVAVLLSWVELLLLSSRLPDWGFSVLMFCKVAKNVLKVLAIFSILFLGFVFSMMIEFKSISHFQNIWQSFTKVLIMTTDLEYDELFENEKESDPDFLWNLVSRSLLLTFVILVTVALMNLMVGIAVNDIQELEDKGRTHRLAKQVSFLSLIEMLVLKVEDIGLFVKLCPKGLKRAIAKRRQVQLSHDLKVGNPFDRGMKIFPMSLRTSIMDKVSDIYLDDNSSSQQKKRLSDRYKC